MSEIITLQIGNYSNYIGSHFWNIQDELAAYLEGQEFPVVNQDVLYRTGQLRDGTPTATPRMVMIDMKGGYGGMKRTGYLYESEKAPPTRAVAMHTWHA